MAAAVAGNTHQQANDAETGPWQQALDGFGVVEVGKPDLGRALLQYAEQIGAQDRSKRDVMDEQVGFSREQQAERVDIA